SLASCVRGTTWCIGIIEGASVGLVAVSFFVSLVISCVSIFWGVVCVAVRGVIGWGVVCVAVRGVIGWGNGYRTTGDRLVSVSIFYHIGEGVNSGGFGIDRTNDLNGIGKISVRVIRGFDPFRRIERLSDGNGKWVAGNL